MYLSIVLLDISTMLSRLIRFLLYLIYIEFSILPGSISSGVAKDKNQQEIVVEFKNGTEIDKIKHFAANNNLVLNRPVIYLHFRLINNKPHIISFTLGWRIEEFLQIQTFTRC